MLEREWLDNITHVVTHANCPDGMASAILLNDALDNVRIDFLTHGTEAYEKLPANPGMLFVDIAPPEARVQEFIDARAIVLDHHAKQRDIVQRFGPRGRFADLEKEPGVSGAMLAFREVWSWTSSEGSTAYHNAYDFADLAGIRDTWQTNDSRWKEACAQAEALRFYPWPVFKELTNTFFGSGFKRFATLLEIGPVLIARSEERLKKSIEQAVGQKTAKGTNVMIVSTLETSDIAEAIGNAADVVIGFSYVGGPLVNLQLSMRSRGSYDVGEFCKSLGGGGHVRAAGARIPVNAGALNPYETIWKLVDDFELRSKIAEPMLVEEP